MTSRVGPLLLLLLLVFSLANNSAFAKSAVCPSTKEILVSDDPGGQFAKSMWQLIDARGLQVNISDSILVFSEETALPDELKLKGYFWWRRDNKIIGCAQLEGKYVLATRELKLRTVQVSSSSIPSKARYSAQLSADGTSLAKFYIKGKDFNDFYHWFFRSGSSSVGNWHAVKIYPSQQSDNTSSE